MSRLQRESNDHHGRNLQRLEPIDVVDKDTDDLLMAMEKTSFGGRALGKAARVLEHMILDRDCFVVMTISGAMTVAQQSLTFCEVIERNYVQAIVSTGALMAHGLVAGTGRHHYQHDPTVSDEELYQRRLNRVYDSLEPEQNLDDVEEIVAQVLRELPDGTKLSGVEFHRLLGEWLSRNESGRGILKSAYVHGVPVYVSAFTDSELALDILDHQILCEKQGRQGLLIDQFADLRHYFELINQQQTLGIFTIGGGHPRNWAQQVGPGLEVVARRLAKSGHKSDYEPKQFKYAVRICPEPVELGGLSGCPYSEGVSWGKFVPERLGGMQAEVPADATIAWPILLNAVITRLLKRGVERVNKRFELSEQIREANKVVGCVVS